MVLAIIFLVLFAGCTGFSIYRTVNLVKSPMIEIDYKKFLKETAYFVLGSVATFLVASFGFYMWLKATPDFLHVFELVVGAILFVGPLLIAIHTFTLHYYGKNIPEQLDKWLFRIQLISFVVAAFAFFIWTNGLAPYLTYPLINGISFSKGFVTPETGVPNIAFYALCILGGAILVYFVCDHFMYKEYGEHGTLESTFLVAFPGGIIGARIWYVIGEWNNTTNGLSFAQRVAEGEWWTPLAIWEGGITILGGAVMGIIVGVLWYIWRNKGKSIWLAIDLIVPTILIAQAVGRWGNFFNCEVHGLKVSLDYFKWLPEIVWRNGQYSDVSGYAGDGYVWVPLFFIESVVNLLGYFVLAHVFGKALRKYTELGDLGAGYIIWYGMTRVLMEPLRSASYKMGPDGYWSWVWSMIFVVVGTLMIVANHIVRHVLRKKNNTYHVKPYDQKLGIISSILIILIGSALIATGAFMMANNAFELKVCYNGFNAGLIVLVLGIAIVTTLGISLPILLSSLKKSEPIHE